MIDGNVLAQKGQVLVEADNNVTVNGNVESRSGEGSGHLPYVGIKAGEDVGVNGALVAHWAEGSKDRNRPEGLKIEGKNITVDAGDANVLYNGAGKTSFVAEESLVLNGKNGLVNEGGAINVVADNIDIVAEDFAVISYSGTTEIAPTGSSNIVGDIFVDDLYGKSTPVVNVDLGENGSLAGAVVNEHTGTGSGVNLDLGEGSTWIVTGNSNVTSLAGNKGNIKVDVTEAGGIATVAIATNNATGTEVTGTGAVSDYLAANGNKAVEEFTSSVTDANGVIDTSMTTEEGMTGGAYTFTQNEKGEWVAEQAVNTKSDAVSDAGMVLKGHWRAHMNDMNKRMGELRNANGEHGVWTRVVRGESEYQGAKMQYNQYQMGYDEKLSVDKRWTVGAAVTFSEGDASYGSGSTDDKSTAFAIYGSKLNNDGTFVDLIARYARLESDLDDKNYGTGNYDTNGYSVSAEFGKRIQQGNGLWIEPQVELTYGSVDCADVAFSNKYNAHYDKMDSFIARAGFALGKDVKQGNVYARASYLYDFDGETETQFEGGKDISEDFGGGWWEVGVGANINLSKATYIYADVEKTFGGEVDTNWQWNLGVRYSF
ncbi:MAG: autotransporter outer membrane beta-barrel domain-containing protein [Phascolarctobacterium sp.]|nr:autotransporter outer membrane beta-barrel domain-containing protein [Phascolarctobacterium sp.]